MSSLVIALSKFLPRLCKPLDGTKSEDVATLFEGLIGNFEDIVQYNKDNRAFEGGKHNNVTVETLCDIMTGKKPTAAEEPAVQIMGNELPPLLKHTWLNRFAVNGGDEGAEENSLELFAKVNDLYLSIHGQKCFDSSYESMVDELKKTSWDSEAGVGGRQWTYQTCTEFGWYQSSGQKGHPYTDRFPASYFEKMCADVYGPRYNLELLERGIKRSNMMYGGRDIQVSNVIFVHGSFDPWHALGITEDMSEEATAILIPGTAHCANMYPEADSDPPALKAARRKVMQKIKEWLRE